MKGLSGILAALCVACLCGEASGATSSGDRVFHVNDPGRVYYKLIYIHTTATWRFRTSLATGGLDTVLHVWNRSTGQWIRSNDDVAGGNCTDLWPTAELTSCRDVNLTAGTMVTVFVHRRNILTSGTCLFEAGIKNGTPNVSEVIEPGGDVIRAWGFLSPISWEAGDKLQAAYTAVHPVENEDIWEHGMLLPTILALAGTEKLYGQALPGRNPFGGATVPGYIWGQPSLTLAAGSASISANPASTFAFGYVVGQSYWDHTSYGDGTVTLYRNDAAIAGRDPDADELGTQMERQLGTCYDASRCPDANPKDTDGDGLRDDWETIGGCTFYGCDPWSSDAINLAYYGGDPVVQNAFFQVDWPKVGDNQVDVQGRLAPTLAQVREAYAGETATTGVSKAPVKLFFDYGQLAAGGAGGNIGPEHPFVCIGSEPRAECIQEWEPCMEWPDSPPGTCEGYCGYQSAGECWCDANCPYMGDCCADFCEYCPSACEVEACPFGYVCEDSDDGVGRVCVTPECGKPCDRSELAHLDGYGPNATFTPYNLQHALRGDASLPHVFVPRNRRGVFGEVWLDTVFPGEFLIDPNHGFFAASSCCESAVEDCPPPRPGCLHLFPGWVALRQVHFIVGSTHDPGFMPLLVFHELGHAFGLLHGWMDDSSQTACVFDHECPATARHCRGGMCTSYVNDVPNYISLMTYNYMHAPGIDLHGRLDYSSGIRPPIRGFRDRGVSCADPACPSKYSAECPIPDYGLSWVEGDACCLEGVCVEAALDEALGIGDFFALPAQPEEAAQLYIDNRDYQLRWLSFCLTNGLNFNSGFGPVPAYLNQPRHEIDWDEDETLDTWLVGAYLFRKDVDCGPWTPLSPWAQGQSNVRVYEDSNEWAFIGSSGFRHFGLNQQPSLDLSPICGSAEAVGCPSGFDCEFGRCTLPGEGYWPPGVPLP